MTAELTGYGPNL